MEMTVNDRRGQNNLESLIIDNYFSLRAWVR